MVFSSITFLFFFLPAVLIAYSCSGRQKNITLLLISLLFYCWGEGIYLLVMLASICMNYFLGKTIYRGSGTIGSARVLALALICNFSILVFFKYGNFLVDNLNWILSIYHISPLQLEPIHLPIGISFFTFQAVSYNIDVYRGVVKPQRSLINIGLYISLFPQLIAGPIVRYHDIASSLIKRRVTIGDFSTGIERFIFGLSKKVLLANPLGLVADKIFNLPPTELSSPVAWLGALCYTFQIYYDFSGYSDMAIGLGRMFGFRFLENFNYPYISKSIQEFWRRWHISLSNWFKDYLYIPLGGNRKGSIRTYINLLIVFTLCGFWHGASWTFLFWGFYHGFFLALERTFIGQTFRKLWSPVRHVTTIVIIITGWVFFRSETLVDAIAFISIMYGMTEGAERNLLALYLDKKIYTELIFAILFAMPLYHKVLCLIESNIQKCNNRPIRFSLQSVAEGGRLALVTCLTYFTVISLAAGVYNPFIYFRF